MRQDGCERPTGCVDRFVWAVSVRNENTQSTHQYKMGKLLSKIVCGGEKMRKKVNGCEIGWFFGNVTVDVLYSIESFKLLIFF